MTIEDEIRDTTMGRPHVVILGAGASVAALPNGDRNGKKLPTMSDLVEVLGLRSEIDALGQSFRPGNFEDLYSDLCADERYADVRNSIEDRVADYFAQLRLPDEPTIYDHTVLSLREKDVIATFN